MLSQLPPRIERLLVQYNAAPEKRVGIGRQVVVICDVAIVGA